RSDLSPNLSYSITGTFNLFVKDRIAFRLSGAPSVQNRSHTNADLSVLETLQNYSARCATVNPRESQDFHNFCTLVKTRPRGALTLLARNQTHLPTGPTCQFSARAEAEAFKLEKRSLGGSCADAKTLRGALSPNANPVAGADFLDLLL